MNSPAISALDAPLSLPPELHRIVDRCIADHVEAPRVTSHTPLVDLVERFSDTAIREEPTTAEAYGRFLRHELLPHAVNVGHPRFIGHMTSPLPEFQADLAKLVTTLNQNVVKVETSKVLTVLERQVLGKLHRLVFDAPPEFYREHLRRVDRAFGVTTSGGTMSNVTALWLARNVALALSDGRSLVEALLERGLRDAVVVGSSSRTTPCRRRPRCWGWGRAT